MTQATAKAPPPPAIPGLEQGNPQVSNRQASQAAPAGQAGQASPGSQTGQPQIPGPVGPRTADQIRNDIRDQIRNSVRNGGEPNIIFPDRFDATNAVPRGAVQISIALFVCLAFTIVFGPLARAIARRVDRQSAAPAVGGNVGVKLDQLQESVDAMSVEIERITEAQRFQSKLLAERAKEPERIG